MLSFNESKYIDLLGLMESKNNYSIVNPIGALGRYQFMPQTLNALKNIYSLPDWKNKNYFLSSPDLQNKYIHALIIDTLSYIKNNNLEKYIGMPVAGSIRFPGIKTKLNIYGMLASAHLAGSPGLKDYLINGNNPNDGQTSLSDYAAFFSDKLGDSINYFAVLLAIIPAIVLYYS